MSTDSEKTLKGINMLGLFQDLWSRYRCVLLPAFLVGMAAHGYAFTNKLLNHDEIESLFGKGATVTSGRWGLELVKVLFPDWSMPWIYGIVSLLLIAVSACLMLDMLNIRGKVLRGTLAAVIVSFPSLTGNFCFMFTASAYAWSFFLAVLSVFLFLRNRPAFQAAGMASLILALGIYQAYISLTASLFLLLMIRETLEGERSVWEIIRFGLRALVWMLVSILLYYGVTLLVLRAAGTGFNSYVTENVNGSVSLIRRVRMAYDAFFYIFSFRNFYIISSEFSRYLHIILCLGMLGSLCAVTLKGRKPLHTALLALELGLLPLSICCMFLIMSQESIHTLVMYSFVSVYLLMGLTAEAAGRDGGTRAGCLLSVPLAAVILGNVYFANMCYLKMELQYENARAFYSVLVSRVESAEGFDPDCCLAIVGRQENLLHRFPELDTELFMGVNRDLVNIYSRENLIRFYLGLDIPFADEQLLESLEKDPRVQEMAEYPYSGSVRRIDDAIVVRLG